MCLCAYANISESKCVLYACVHNYWAQSSTAATLTHHRAVFQPFNCYCQVTVVQTLEPQIELLYRSVKKGAKDDVLSRTEVAMVYHRW